MQRKAIITLLIAGAGCAGALLGGCSYTPRDAFYDSRKVVYESRAGSGAVVSLERDQQTVTDARRR